MELRHLRCFVAVADEQHMGRAALQLRVAQQSVSEQVRDLERELGVALFVRHARGVTLTRAGAEFLVHARDVLARAQAAVEHVRSAGRDGARLRVGLLECGAASAGFPQVVAAFRARYPHVAVEIAPAPLAAHGAAVVAGRLDVGFSVGGIPDGVRAAGDVTAECVYEDALAGVLLPSAHPLAGAACVDPTALSALPCVDFPAALMPEKHESDLARLRAAGGAVGSITRSRRSPRFCPWWLRARGGSTSPRGERRRFAPR